MKKRVIIFGATGRTGKELVKGVLRNGHETTAFVRDQKKLKGFDRNVNVFVGDVLNSAQVNSAVQNQDVVMVNLGMPASDKSTLRADGTFNIIQAMKAQSVRRLIVQTSLGFGDSKEVLPWQMKYIIVPFILKNAFKDHELQEEHITSSGLDWTIVRPGNLTNGRRKGVYKLAFDVKEKIKLKVSRADVADFMLKQIEDIHYIGHKVGISY